MKYLPRWRSNAKILIEERDYILAAKWKLPDIPAHGYFLMKLI